MKNRSTALQQRGGGPAETLRRRAADADSMILTCMLSLIRGTAPSASLRARGGAILFEAGSSELDGPAKAVLRSAVLGVDPGLRVLIGGFTSQPASTSNALGLALRRVQGIRGYLRSRGIGPGRIDVAVCGAGWFLVERSRGATEGGPFVRCLLEIVDPQWALSRN